MNFSKQIPYRVLGIGNAGVNFLDRLLLAQPSFGGLVALNNDQEALLASVVPTQITFAPASDSTAGLAEIKERLIQEIGEVLLVVLTGGLGGSVASALLPEVAALCKELKKVVLACVTLPFSFEGKRVQEVANNSLAALEEMCDGVILLDNNTLGAADPVTAKLGETFVASDEIFQNMIPGLLGMFLNKGPVRITRADLLKALSRRRAKVHFGYGQAVGPNRLHEAMERAFKHPLLDRGRFLAKAESIFILLRGPKDLSFAEAQMAMQEVERLAQGERDIQLSVQADGGGEAPLQLFVLAVAGGKEPSLEKPVQALSKPSNEKPIPVSKPISTKKIDSDLDLPELFPKTVYQNPSTTSTEPKSSSASKSKATQGALNLTAAQRGRFDKSEPTIVEGEDLDTPTYLRWGLKLN